MQPAELDTTASPAPRPRRRRTRLRYLFLLVVVGGYLAWCATLFFLQTWLIFPRDLAPEPLRRTPPGVVEWTMPADAGRTAYAWFTPEPKATAAHPVPAAIVFHGNAEIIDFQDRIPREYRRLGMHVLAPEYPGYGRAPGEPSQKAIVSDAIAWFDRLKQRPEVDTSRIVIHGYSVGGGVAAQLAAARSPRALVIEASFTSLSSFARKYAAPTFLVKHPFDTAAVLPGIPAPILIMHGCRDDIVSVDHGRRLHALVPTSTYFELDCGHLNLPGPDPAAYTMALREFLERSGIITAPAATRPASQP